jgi:four helix bundle protein
MTDDIEYDAWVRTVPPEITTDTIWRTPAYRFALYMMSRAQQDVRLMSRHRTTRPHIDQLLRAVGSISANLEEGYSRSSGRERAHFYEYALGSARESRGWCYKCTIAFPSELSARRMTAYTRIIKILTAIVPREREQPTLKPPKRNGSRSAQPLDHPAASSTSKQ